LKRQLRQRDLIPSLPQAARLQQHCAALCADTPTVRLGIVHTYTSELLDPWLHLTAALNGLSLDIYHAPYGVTIQEAQTDSGLARFGPDVTLLLLRKEDLHPALQLPPACLEGEQLALVTTEIQSALTSLLQRFRDTVSGHLLVSLLPDFNGPSLGLYDDNAERSETRWWSALKGALADTFRNAMSGVALLDMEQLMMQVGRNRFFDSRLWYSSSFPFSSDGCYSVSCALTDICASLHLTKAKVIALDADNTLWGGVIGEDGLDGIALGEEYPGRAYRDFQKRLLALQQRGFILVLCSKNNPLDLDEVLNTHPHQLLKHEHFAAQRVNWLPKPDNLRSIAEELNLGLDAFIFVDDSEHECAAVRHSLPQVEVVQVPLRANEIPGCLDTLARLQITSLTAEDLAKTALYAREKQRKSQLAALTADGGSVEDYLRSLDMHMTVGVDADRHLPRLAQLTQKTNQFNLTTRRYSEPDMAGMIADARTSVFHFSLADTFGDSGLVGLAIVRHGDAGDAEIDSFLMSCRVIGRSAEFAFLARIIEHLKHVGVRTLAARFLPTRKNAPASNFLAEAGFRQLDNGEYRLHLTDSAAGKLAGDFYMTIEGP
ncbi:MAG: HAD-IIIC family phosphatase, partial [Halioglobus sp.]|nr:HAD-IIIC family phosphatase [Halioglobus sp.]